MNHKCSWNPCPFGVYCKHYNNTSLSCSICKEVIGSEGLKLHKCATLKQKIEKDNFVKKTEFLSKLEQLRKEFKQVPCFGNCTGRPHRSLQEIYCQDCQDNHLNEVYNKPPSKPKHVCKPGTPYSQSHVVYRIQHLIDPKTLIWRPILRSSNDQAECDREFYSDFSIKCSSFHFTPEMISTKHNQDETPALPSYSSFFKSLRTLVKQFGGDEYLSYHDDM